MTDSTFRSIDIEGLAAGPIKSDAGAVPMLQWLEIASLVVDPTYQREIGEKGRRNVGRIAAEFRWTRFSPVVVSPVEGGKFAVIDGQHRTSAALLRGFSQVPCQIIVASRQEQADAFRAINAAVTRVSPMQVFHAAIVSGDAMAIEIAEITAGAGVRILRNNLSSDRMAKGDTLAVSAIYRVRREFGADVLKLALACITRTSNNFPGAVNAMNILALGEMLAADGGLRSNRAELLRVFDVIELEQEAMEFQESRGARAGKASTAFAQHLGRRALQERQILRRKAADASTPPPPLQSRARQARRASDSAR